MSIEIFVLSDRRLGSIEEWQKAIEQDGFPLRLSTECTFERLNGYLPANWRDKSAGFECDHFDAAEFIDNMRDFDFGRRWGHVLAFRFGGDFNELMGAYAAAAAYARATDGVLFDGESGEVLAPDQALQAARDIVKSVSE